MFDTVNWEMAFYILAILTGVLWIVSLGFLRLNKKKSREQTVVGAVIAGLSGILWLADMLPVATLLVALLFIRSIWIIGVNVLES